MEHPEVEMHLDNGAVIYCTAKAAKYLIIGFGLRPVVTPSAPDPLELLLNGDVEKVAKK